MTKLVFWLQLIAPANELGFVIINKFFLQMGHFLKRARQDSNLRPAD